MGNWWHRFLVWLGISEPGLRREELEDWIEANPSTFGQIRADQATTRSPRGDHRQIRRQDRHLPAMPVWSEFWIDVYEAPVDHATKTTRFGYTFGYTVTELDGSVWTLTDDPEDELDPVWKEIPSGIGIP
jgi:hypothetical protein